MLRITPMIAFAGIIALGACAQPEPEPIQPQPTFDKYGQPEGGGGCTGSQTAGATGECLPDSNYYEQPGSDGGQTGGQSTGNI